MQSLPHDQHHSPDWYVVYQGWTHTDTPMAQFTLELPPGGVLSVGSDKWIMIYVHPYNITQAISITLKVLCFLPSATHPPLVTTDHFMTP